MKTKNLPILIIFTLSLLWDSGLRAQDSGIVKLSFDSYPSSGYNMVYQPGMNGSGISLEYGHYFGKTWGFFGGFEYRVSDWGNLLLLDAGINTTWWEQGRFSFNSDILLINGLALFRPQPLYVFGAEANASFQFRVTHRFGIFAVAGVRWTTCPAYRHYGLITSYVEMPLGIGVRVGIPHKAIVRN